jgi:two-component system sensor histidine kinase DegS
VELQNNTTPRIEEITAAAITAMREHKVKLAAIEETARAAADALGLELLRAREDGNAVAAQLDELEGELSRRRAGELAVKIVALRDHQRELQQQEGHLGERLKEFAALSRRLQLTMQESEANGPGLTDAGTRNNRSRLAGHMTWQVAQAEEDERERLAREIHDGPAQVLANAIFELEFCERLLEKDPGKLRQEIVRLKENLRQSLGDVRHFMFGFRPAILTELGLAAALRRFSEGFQRRSGIPVSLDFDELPRLTGTQETAIFRIVQEGFQNAYKHSEASALVVSMHTSNEKLEIVIADNGQGFDVATTAKLSTDHFGLRGMQDRARLLGATIEIDSKPVTGTRITLTVALGAHVAQRNE